MTSPTRCRLQHQYLLLLTLPHPLDVLLHLLSQALDFLLQRLLLLRRPPSLLLRRLHVTQVCRHLVDSSLGGALGASTILNSIGESGTESEDAGLDIRLADMCVNVWRLQAFPCMLAWRGRDSAALVLAS